MRERAWRCEVLGFDPCIVIARSRSAAKARVVLSARDAGYGVRFADRISIKRAPQFDALSHTVCLRLEDAESAP